MSLWWKFSTAELRVFMTCQGPSHLACVRHGRGGVSARRIGTTFGTVAAETCMSERFCGLVRPGAQQFHETAGPRCARQR